MKVTVYKPIVESLEYLYYCTECGINTPHLIIQAGDIEAYVCRVCQSRQEYKVR